MQIHNLSENALVISYQKDDAATHFSLVKLTYAHIKAELHEYIIEVIPSYDSVYIHFNRVKISGEQLRLHIEQIVHAKQQKLSTDNVSYTHTKHIEIPVYYGEEVAFDLQALANAANLHRNDVIDIHTATIYDVYAIGFAPGFAYLGHVDTRIASARKETPRQSVPQGSVGIADRQTAVYPSASPGGWQIIGRTPVNIVDYDNKKLCPFTVGDRVTFYAISLQEYKDLGGECSCR